ncbi:hypothetical protein [Salinimicrobium sp. GXAS 041]|uniref:hypothetical protein n=1 Tax=Salinimicrobium sp. GXAS 041 TaxID=3400806 RepID=UPI003C76B7FD
MKTPNPSEIDRLYQFTRQHYVEFYDLQTELVDHLANGIEQQWKENTEIPFEEALQKEFKKFGIFGFSDVVEKRQRAMEKKYWEIIWKEAKVILQEPKMTFLMLFLFGFSFFLQNSETGIYFLIGLLLISSIVALVYIGLESHALKKRMKKGEKIYLLEAMIFNAGGSFSLLWLPIHILSGLDFTTNIYIQSAVAFFIIIIVLTSYICFYKLPKKKDEILKKVHPELKYL